MNTHIPVDLVFDDEPLDGILYETDAKMASPADIFEYWRGHLPLNSLTAVVAILVRSPEKGLSLGERQQSLLMDYVRQSLPGKEEDPRELLKLALICSAAGNLEQTELFYRRALDSVDGNQQLREEERRRAINNLAVVLEQMGRPDEAREERRLRQGEMLLADGEKQDFLTVRSLALDLFLDGRHWAAERLYRGLIERGFEQPGTLVHLARVLLMQDRLPEARKAIAGAWKLTRNKETRQETPDYVLHRILFFRILCAMLTRGDYSRPAVELKRDLLENPGRVTWRIGPVLEHLHPYLRPADVIFLEALAEAISTGDNTERLNAFAVWRSEDLCNELVK